MRFPNILWLDEIVFNTLRNIANNSSTSGFIIDLLSRYPKCEIQQDVLYNSNCPVKTIIRLSDSKSYFTLCAVYWNRKTPLHILEKLSLSELSGVRRQFCYDRRIDRQLGNLKTASLSLSFLIGWYDSI